MVNESAALLAEGQARLDAGSPVDALILFRRALAVGDRNAEAYDRLGGLAWTLEDVPGAIAQWKAAIAANPAHLGARANLAEALASEGDFDAALEAGRSALALRPGSRRIGRLVGLLGVALGDPTAARVTAQIGQRRPWPLALLARVLEVKLAARGDAGEDEVAALLEAIAHAGVTAANADALRRIAVALDDADRPEDARALGARYGAACRAFLRARGPLLWPLRTAGSSPRVGVLVDARFSQGDAAMLGAAIGTAGADPGWLLMPESGEAAAVGNGNTRVLPDNPELGAAAIATLDLDVLIDACGMRAPIGSLLASRPARALWSLVRDDASRAAGFADRDLDRDAVGPALRALAHDLALEPVATRTAAELSLRFSAAVRAHQQGDPDAAKEGYAAILAAEPGHAASHLLAGRLLRERGEIDDARVHLEAAVASAPDYLDARIELIDMQLSCGDRDAALKTVRAGLEAKRESMSLPGRDVAMLLRALGRIEAERGEVKDALAAFDEALAVDALSADAHFRRGIVLQGASRHDEAAQAYERALAVEPEFADAEFNLAIIRDERGDRPSAAAGYARVVRHQPAHAAAYRALGDVLLASGDVDGWFANFDRFRERCPPSLALASYALEVHACRADYAAIARQLDELRRLVPDPNAVSASIDALEQIGYLLNFFDVEPELVGRLARMHDSLAVQEWGAPMPPAPGRRPGPIRVGYLSGDFRDHVMGKMMWPVLSRHDRSRFELFAYSTSAAEDEWTARFRGVLPRFDALTALDDRAAASRIATDDLDLLVDLSSHTRGGRPGILALKPARTEITHVASASALGLSAIDYKLTDRFADLPGPSVAQIETPLVMDGCVYPFRHVDPAPPAVLSSGPGELGRRFVIGAFVTPLKLSRRCMALWRDVLMRIPEAVLAFSPNHPGLAPVYLGIIRAAGIDASRIVFVPQGRDEAENRARYRLVDAVLDPMPYGGVNGTLEALDMGVPVVTLVGRRHGERSSYSILANLGVNETIAQSGSEYVELALRLARDRSFMASVREHVVAAIAHSPLTDLDAHVRNLESAYVAALEARAPEALGVQASRGPEIAGAGAAAPAS